MGKRRRFLLVTILISVIAALLWSIFGRGKQEPSYQGKTLSQYLNQSATNRNFGADYKMLDAVYHMGPAAIPPLRQVLRRKNSYSERTLRFLHAHLPPGLARHLPATNADFYLDKMASDSAWCLEVFGPRAREALPDLIACFNRPFAGNLASYAVMEIGPQPGNLPQLLPLLKSTNGFAPILAAQCIARIGITNGGVIEALTNFAGTGTGWSRKYAVDALGEFGPKAYQAIPLLTANLKKSDAELRIASALALRKIQQQSNPPVAWFVKELDAEVHHGSPPVNAPKDSDGVGTHEIVLMGLVGFLSERGADARDAVPLLRTLRNDSNIRVRLSAYQALWKIAGETNDYLAVHADATNYTPSVQQWSVRQLTEYCLEQHMAAPLLDDLLLSKDPAVAARAARALWKLKGETGRTVPALAAALDDHVTYGNSAEVRQLAAETLGEMRDKARPALPSITSALSDPYENIRRAATNALKQIDPAAAAKAGIK